jgi:tetratricopeptide (TPR) repeat protein
MIAMRGVRLLLVLGLMLSTVAHAQTQRLDRAKKLYSDGKVAYEQGDYQKAYEMFKESYLLSHEPALLYNVASALQGLKRPHDAAEALRSFLRIRSDDPEKPAIEDRIRVLEEEQKLLDAEQRPPPEVVPPKPRPIVIITPKPDEAALVATRDEAERERRKKKVWMGVGISLGILAVAGAAVGLGLGLSSSNPTYTPATFGPLPGTR